MGGWEIGIVSRLQRRTPVNLGNGRLVGMSVKDVQGMFKLRFDNAGKQVYMLPQDVVDNTILAFNVSATAPTGYACNTPAGRYFAPANGPDCIEINNNSFVDCGSRALVLNGPPVPPHHIPIPN